MFSCLTGGRHEAGISAMLKGLISNGWSYHETASERLAQELEAADLAELEGDESAEALRLSNHTIGEHLGDWARARQFAERVCSRGHLRSAGAGAHLAVARYMDGAMAAAQQAEIESLGAAQDSTSAYLAFKALLGSALAGSGRFADAGLVLSAANELASAQDAPMPSDREMAVVNNNVASALHATEDLDSEHHGLMLSCAEAALRFWRICGTWMNEQRALYLLALVSNRGGDFRQGLEHALAALDVIEANGGENVDEAFIRLAAAVAYAGFGYERGHHEELISADALAAKWSDDTLTAAYHGERAKAG